MRTTTIWLAAACAAFAAAGAVEGCSQDKKKQAAPITTLIVKEVARDLSKPSPLAEFWDDIDEGSVTMMGQPMITPRPASTTTDVVNVKAAHDGKRVAFRLRWKDTEKSEAGRLGEFSDGFALEFPLDSGGPLPPVMMGAKDQPVHLFHWRAQYQRDKLKGKPSMKDLYPNYTVDMYPHEFKSAPGSSSPAAAEKFSPATAQGNPQAYAKTGVDEIVAEGFSTSAVQQGHGSQGHAEWKDGEWTLVIVRPLAIEGGSTLKRGGAGNIAFAAWQGGKGEVGSRKSVTMQWMPVRVQ